MAPNLPYSLYLKSRIVGTPIESVSKELRWMFGAVHRHQHPELWEIHLEERRIPLILQRLLTDDSHCVDVGCHIGSFLSLLIHHAPKGRHIAFEPSTMKNEWLKTRFPSVEVISKAVSDQPGTATFQENIAKPGYSRLTAESGASAANTTSYEVNICRLDDVLLDRQRLDLIKLDIEGGELAALRGAQLTVRKFLPSLIFECGPALGTPDEVENRQKLYEFLTGDLNYDVYCFSDFLFGKGPLTAPEFKKSGLYPFRAFNFVALARGRS